VLWPGAAELAAAICDALPELPLALPALSPADVRWWVARAFAWVCARAAAAAAAELAAGVREDGAGGVEAAEATDVGAGGGGSAECSAVESGAGNAGSDGSAVAAVGGGAAGAIDRVGGVSASVTGARATGGIAASGAEARTGGGAVKGFGGGARSGGTIRNPATATATTAPPIMMARDGVLFAGGGALNLGACAAPCFTARSAAICAAWASTLRRANSLGLLESSAEARL
jgi:hypothetical protein